MSIDIAYRFGNSYCSIERERWAKAKRTTAITTRVTSSFSCVSTDLSALPKKWFDPKLAWNRWLLSSLPEYDLLIASPNQGPKSELMILHGDGKERHGWLNGPIHVTVPRSNNHAIWASITLPSSLAVQTNKPQLGWALHQSPGHRLSNLPDSKNRTS